MEAIEFIKSIKKVVVDDALLYYKDTLEKNVQATEPTWKEFLKLFKNLTKEQQATCLNFIKLVQVDVVSNIFGILDGSSYLNEQNEEFSLTTKNDPTNINGDLQSLFLELVDN